MVSGRGPNTGLHNKTEGAAVRRGAVAIIALAITFGGLPAAQASTPATFRESRVYFTCKGGDQSKLQNPHGVITWDAQAPTRSAADGAGCGFADPGTYAAPALDPHIDTFYVGHVAGNIRNVTVEAWLAGPPPEAAARGELPLAVEVLIDGNEDVYWSEDVPEMIPIKRADNGATYKVEFTLTNLDPWITLEAGDGATVRELELRVSAAYGNANWVWGAREVAAGLTFNDATPSPVEVGW